MSNTQDTQELHSELTAWNNGDLNNNAAPSQLEDPENILIPAIDAYCQWASTTSPTTETEQATRVLNELPTISDIEWEIERLGFQGDLIVYPVDEEPGIVRIADNHGEIFLPLTEDALASLQAIDESQDDDVILQNVWWIEEGVEDIKELFLTVDDLNDIADSVSRELSKEAGLDDADSADLWQKVCNTDLPENWERLSKDEIAQIMRDFATTTETKPSTETWGEIKGELDEFPEIETEARNRANIKGVFNFDECELWPEEKSTKENLTESLKTYALIMLYD